MRIALASFSNGEVRCIVPESDHLLSLELLRRGHEVFHVAWDEAGVDWAAMDAVVIRSCWDYHLRVEEFRQWLYVLEQCGARVFNAVETVRWNLNKRYLRELHVALPDTVWVEAGAMCDVEVVVRERGWERAVVKPMVSASAHETRVLEEGVVRGPVLVQEFLPEIAGGEWSVIFLGGTFHHAVLKRPADGEFRVQKEYGGTAVRREAPAAVIEFAGDALRRGPEALLARVDVVERWRGDVVLMELELIEPELFLDAGGAARVADVLEQAIRQG